MVLYSLILVTLSLFALKRRKSSLVALSTLLCLCLSMVYSWHEAVKVSFRRDVVFEMPIVYAVTLSLFMVLAIYSVLGAYMEKYLLLASILMSSFILIAFMPLIPIPLGGLLGFDIEHVDKSSTLRVMAVYVLMLILLTSIIYRLTALEARGSRERSLMVAYLMACLSARSGRARDCKWAPCPGPPLYAIVMVTPCFMLAGFGGCCELFSPCIFKEGVCLLWISSRGCVGRAPSPRASRV